MPQPTNPRLYFLQQQLQEIDRKIRELEPLLQDQELKNLAAEELEQLQQTRKQLQQSLRTLEQEPNSTTNDNNEEKGNVILEIRAATGGDEAGLFAHDLLRMYLKFAEKKGWRVETLSLKQGEIGNIKEAALLIRQGKSPFVPSQELAFESGVHRVQRIPVTESSGRIHTSTATVAVLPEIQPTKLEIRSEDLIIETFRASGPGGQHVNKNETAVRIIHRPSGLVVSSQQARSQQRNKEAALALLRSRLYQREEAQRQASLTAKRRHQIGRGERAEKIRTYNFPQDRVTDHRIKKSWHKINKILDGELEPIIKALQTASASVNDN